MRQLRGRWVLGLLIGAGVLASACDDGGTGTDAGMADGGGGGDDAGPGDAGPSGVAGRFEHGNVEGLAYSTETHSGMTNAEGEFRYEAGETVTFSVGDIVLGEAPGADVITPFDLVGIDPPTTAQEQRLATVRARNFPEGQPFEVAINIALFLQTIDDDGDETNGIQIPEEMHTSATGMSLDFELGVAEFYASFGLRRVIGTARQAGLWGGHRAIRHPGFAANALYEALGITPMIGVWTSREEDDGGDGTLDFVSAHAYDATGLRTRTTSDSDGEGARPASVSTAAHDANGRRIEDLSDSDEDVSNGVNYRYTYENDLDGQQVYWFDDEDANPENGVNYAEHITYDVYGSLLSYVGDDDTDPDNGITLRRTLTYDEEGRRTSDERDVDLDPDNGVTSRVTFSYDDDGNMILEEHMGSDGSTVTERRRHEYDGNGYRTREQREMPDGTVTFWQTRLVDANGQMTLERADNGNDGVDRRRVFSYDANGNQIYTESDDDDNPSNGIQRAVTSTWDSAGNRTSLVTDDDLDLGNGYIETRRYTYDENANLTGWEVDDDDDPDNGVISRSTLEVTLTGWGAVYYIVF